MNAPPYASHRALMCFVVNCVRGICHIRGVRGAQSSKSVQCNHYLVFCVVRLAADVVSDTNVGDTTISVPVDSGFQVGDTIRLNAGMENEEAFVVSALGAQPEEK